MQSTNNPWEIINEIKRDVGKIANKIVYTVAIIAMDDLVKAHKNIMKSYYEGYTPVDHYFYDYTDKDGVRHSGITHGYRRTYNLGENSRTPIGVVRKGKHSCRAIINISSDNMEDYTNHVTGSQFPASSVFDLVWNKGIRGLPPGNRGHIGKVEIDTDLYGIHLSNSPSEAMIKFISDWGYTRGREITDDIDKYVNVD